MHGKMKFAIVGAGVIAPQHAVAITSHPHAELAAVVDVEEEKARELAERFGASRVYSDLQEMLKDEDIQVVSVCVPSGTHAEVAIAAAQAGKHVFCEKPLDITSSKMTELIEVCRRQGVKLGCVFQRRTVPASLMAMKVIREGKLGKLVLGDVYLKHYRSPAYYKSASWRGTWALDGGGALMNQGIHGVDLIQWLMGEVHSVYAYAAPLVREIEVEDTAVAVVRYKNGAFGVIQAATSVYPGQQARFEVHGEKGTIAFDDSGFLEWKFIDSEEEKPVVEARISSKDDPTKITADGHYILIDDLIQAIRDEREPLINGEEARKSVDVVLAIYESARTGKEVIVNS